MKSHVPFSHRIALVFSAIALSCTVAPAQTTAPVYFEPLGIALEAWPYPQPVQFLDLEIQGQKLRMAYMDVRPKEAKSGTVLLLHGKNFFGAYWEPTIRALADAGFRVIVP